MIVARCFPDKESPNIIRSCLPLGNQYSFPTRFDLMTKPTPVSRLLGKRRKSDFWLRGG